MLINYPDLAGNLNYPDLGLPSLTDTSPTNGLQRGHRLSSDDATPSRRRARPGLAGLGPQTSGVLRRSSPRTAEHPGPGVRSPCPRRCCCCCLIHTLGALPPRGGPVQDPNLTQGAPCQQSGGGVSDGRRSSDGLPLGRRRILGLASEALAPGGVVLAVVAAPGVVVEGRRPLLDILLLLPSVRSLHE